MQDKDNDHHSFLHENKRDLLYILEVKYNQKRYKSQIKRLAASKVFPTASDRYATPRFPHKMKSSNGVLKYNKKQGKKTPNHKGSQRYCVLCKESGMSYHKNKLNSPEILFGNIPNQEYIKEILGGILVNSNDTVKHLQKSENKGKRELKYLKEKNK